MGICGASRGGSDVAHASHHDSPKQMEETKNIGLLWVTGQNGIGQNGTDKMVRTKWHGQNGINFYRFQFN